MASITADDLRLAADLAGPSDERRKKRLLEAAEKLDAGEPLFKLGLDLTDPAYAQGLSYKIEGDPGWETRFQQAFDDLEVALHP